MLNATVSNLKTLTLLLRYLYYIWNKNVKDIVSRTLHHKACVGEEPMDMQDEQLEDSL